MNFLRQYDWTRPAVRDAVIIVAICLMAYGVGKQFYIVDSIAKLLAVRSNRGVNDLILICMVLSVALSVYGYRRLRDLSKEIEARRGAEREVHKTIHELTRTQAFLNTIVENVPATIFVRELPEARFVLINREGERLHGMSRREMLGKTAADIFPAATARIVADDDRKVLQANGTIVFAERPVSTAANGTRVTVATGVAIPDDDGKPRYLLNVIQDVTERKRVEAQIEHLAHYDPLTDLPNRAAFNEHIEGIVERAATTGESFAMLCIDLDRFKEVNDVFGHAVGDALLCEIATRLQAASDGAFVARIGGDEFVVVSAEGPQPETASTLADRLFRAIDGDIEMADHVLHAAMSIGIAICPQDGADSSVLLANADAALYRAKAEGRGAVRFFEPDMDRLVREKRALQQDLRSALAHGELTLFYQPQASIHGKVTGFEALLRWNHPTRGMVPPNEFIPLAEENGLIIPLGEWVMREACKEAASWPSPLKIAINLSPIQFQHGDLPALVHTVLFETGLAANRLEVEITEGVLIADFARAVAILRQLKALGVRIAMDDFGTGYSSLSYLQAFPFDKIKIDQAFIANLERNPQSAAIIRAVIGLGRGLNLPVVAEGVETKAQFDFLEREECNEIQGYLIGRPAPIAQYSEFTRNTTAVGMKALAG